MAHWRTKAAKKVVYPVTPAGNATRATGDSARTSRIRRLGLGLPFSLSAFFDYGKKASDDLRVLVRRILACEAPQHRGKLCALGASPSISRCEAVQLKVLDDGARWRGVALSFTGEELIDRYVKVVCQSDNLLRSRAVELPFPTGDRSGHDIELVAETSLRELPLLS